MAGMPDCRTDAVVVWRTVMMLEQQAKETAWCKQRLAGFVGLACVVVVWWFRLAGWLARTRSHARGDY